MTLYEHLEQHAYEQNIILMTESIPINGLYYATPTFTSITLNKDLQTTPERTCVLAEELGHHHNRPPDLFAASKAIQNKYERLAVQWAVNALIPLSRIVSAWQTGVRTRWDLAEYLGVTEPFLQQSLEQYRRRYGLSVRLHNYLLTFDLLHIQEVS